MKRRLLAVLLAVISFAQINAQVENRALRLESTGSVDCGALPELNGLSSFTVQMWINPTEWSGTVLKRGNLSVSLLSGTNYVDVTVGEQSIVATALGAGQWQQLTIVNNNGSVNVYVDMDKEHPTTGTVTTALNNNTKLKIGGGYKGLIDEIRIWDTAIDDTYAYFWNNTLNEFNDLRSHLVVYYKMDHEEWTGSLVDYNSLWGGAVTRL